MGSNWNGGDNSKWGGWIVVAAIVAIIVVVLGVRWLAGDL